eukprot:1613508-Rhodomonas_salina.1
MSYSKRSIPFVVENVFRSIVPVLPYAMPRRYTGTGVLYHYAVPGTDVLYHQLSSYAMAGADVLYRRRTTTSRRCTCIRSK